MNNGNTKPDKLIRVAVILACGWMLGLPVAVHGQATLTIVNISAPQDGTDFDFMAQGPGFTDVTVPEEQGCLVNLAAAPVLTGAFFTDDQMTNSLCYETCGAQGFLFAATQDGNGCYCGSTPFNINGPSTNCNSSCFGNPFETCGGSDEFTVWTTGGDIIPAPALFTLDDEPSQTDAVDQNVTFNNLPAGDYTITEENLLPGWTLSDIDCGAAPHVRNADSVTVTVADNDAATCTFANVCSGGDGDHDGDVDLVDYVAFESCLTGSEGGLPAGCECYDADADNDVDLRDFAAFQTNFTG